MADSTGDATGQHAEGIQHIASNATPAGTTDTSRGTEGGLGTGAESTGVSSSKEQFHSPLYPGESGHAGTSGTNLEQTSSQGGLVDTVKSYLGMGAGTGTNAAETGQLGTGESRRNVEDTTYPAGSGSGAGLTGAAGSASSAAGLSEGNSAAGGGLGSTASSSATPADTTTGSTSGSVTEVAKEKLEDATNTNTSREHKPVTSGDDDHKPPKPADGKPHKLENESSIPTAGGERLGEKHWGESSIVPDQGNPRASEAGISSEAGQPTQQTSDNTSKNMGGATGPPPGSNAGGSGNDHGSSGQDSGEGKQKMTDKIKDKLHMGKK